ncbi:hypothetical protein BDW75DRAFT_239830 [Aspergillus navahoensis]
MNSIAITIAAKSSLFEQANPPLTPVTSAQWKSALQEIKLLYIQKQYKRCVARSSSILAAAREPVRYRTLPNHIFFRTILPGQWNHANEMRYWVQINPIYKLYLHFYSAICYEAMGMYAHEYSSKKVPLLREALGCLAACLSAFPAGMELRQTARRDSGIGLDVDVGFGPKVRRKADRGGNGDEDDCSDDVFETEPRVEPHAWADAPSRSTTLSPSPSPYASTAGSRSRSRSISPADSIMTSITDIIDKTLDRLDGDPFLSDSDSEDITDTGFEVGLGFEGEDRNSIHFIGGEDVDAELEAELESEPEHRLVPSPLQVRKSKPSSPLPLIPPSLAYCNGNGNTLQVQHSHPQAKAASSSDTNPRPRPLRLPFNMDTDLAAMARGTGAGPLSFAYAYTYTPEQSAAFVSPSSNTITHRHMRNYNSNLSFLHAQITNTIIHLQTLIQEVTATQQARNTSRRSVGGGFQRSASFWSFSPVKNNEKEKTDESTLSSRRLPSLCPRRTSTYTSCAGRESIQDRITRLRTEGWETVGLKNPERRWKGAEYYRDFCGMVLDELYLG